MSAVECAAENSDNIHIVSIFDGNCCLALNLTSKLIVNPLLQIAKNMQEIIYDWLLTKLKSVYYSAHNPATQHTSVTMTTRYLNSRMASS